MMPFHAKDGRLITPVEHIARFKGKRNSAKGKTLIWLLHLRGKYRTAKEISQEIGVNHDTLRSRLTFWYNIRYVNRKATAPASGRPVWAYCIAERGEKFATTRIPEATRTRYILEINEYRAQKSRNIQSAR